MKKFIKISSFLLAFAMIVTSFVMFSANNHVHAADPEVLHDGPKFSVADNGNYNATDFTYYYKGTASSTDMASLVDVATAATGTSYYGNLSITGLGRDASTPYVFKATNGKIGLQVPSGGRTTLIFEAPYTGTYVLNHDLELLSPKEKDTLGEMDLWQRIALFFSTENTDGTYTQVGTTDIHWSGVTNKKSTEVTLTAGQKIAIHVRSYFANGTLIINDLSLQYKVADNEFSVADNGNYNATDFTYYYKGTSSATDMASLVDVNTAATGTSYYGNLSITGLGRDASTPYVFKATNGTIGLQVPSGGRTTLVFEAPYTGTYVLNHDLELLSPKEKDTLGQMDLWQRIALFFSTENEDGTYTQVGTTDIHWSGVTNKKSTIVNLEAGQKIAIHVRSYFANGTLKINKLSLEYHVAGDGFVKVDETNHAPKCANCDAAIGATAAHTGGTANCQSAKVCDVCDQTYGSVGDHTPATDYSKDADYHWKECSVNGCGETIDGSREEHDFTNGNCVCGQPKPACDHANCTKTYTHDANGHVATWTCGKVDTTDTAHDFTNGNCVCGEAKPVHTHDNCTKTYTNNGDEHIAEWSCGEVDANDTEHDFTNGNCVCGAEKPAPVTPPAPPTGDAAISISIALAAMAILGFAVVTKKRH